MELWIYIPKWMTTFVDSKDTFGDLQWSENRINGDFLWCRTRNEIFWKEDMFYIYMGLRGKYAKVIFCRDIIYIPKLYYYIKTNSRSHIRILLLMWVKDYKMLYPHRKFCFLTGEQHLSDYFHYISLWRMIVGIQDKEHWPSYLPRDVEATSLLESTHRSRHCSKLIQK